MGKIIDVCLSEKKGTQKRSVEEGIFIEDFGLKNDAHAGKWHRQVSLLSYEKVIDFNERGAGVISGDFGENLVVEGYDLKQIPVGTKFKCNDVILEITQIGKKCHNGCEIYKKMGECIMPKEGIFAKVLHGGVIKPGDTIEILEKEMCTECE